MKKLIVALLMTSPFMGLSQEKAELQGDKIVYQQRTFAVGDTVTLLYGSSNNKGFAFVSLGSGLTGFTPLTANMSKSRIIIRKVQKTQGKVYATGVLADNKYANALGAGKILIDIEGAIDNKELQ
jgi:hypothetical protein